jgi:hypothetical protein
MVFFRHVQNIKYNVLHDIVATYNIGKNTTIQYIF